MMKGKEIEILEKFRQLTDENKTIILGGLLPCNSPFRK